MYQVDASAPGGFRVEEELVTLDGWRPVATIRPDSATGMNNPRIFPILTDHLGTPRKVLDGNTGQVRWSWDAKQPFGHELPNEAPTAGLPAFTFDVRFPGQRFDEETGLFQNGFRDYHPGLGRYVQSDPLGLEAGWNTYAYAGNAATYLFDPTGLFELNAANTAAFIWGINAELLPGIGEFSVPRTVCQTGEAFQAGSSLAGISNYIAPFKGGIKSVLSMASRKPLRTASGRIFGRHGDVQGAIPGNQSHHVIQDAAVRHLPNYSRYGATAVSLRGGSWAKDEHGFASSVQRKAIRGGGTYAAERRIGYRGLREAGVSRQESREIISHSDSYFRSIGVTPSTPTNIPKDRR